MQSMGRVLRHIENARLRQIDVHLGGRFRSRRELKHHLDSVDGPVLNRLRNRLSRGNQRVSGAAPGVVFAETGVHVAALAPRKRAAELISRAASHGVACDHALGNSCFHETRGSYDFRPSRQNIGFAGHAFHARIVIAVAVRIDDGPTTGFRGRLA